MELKWWQWAIMFVSAAVFVYLLAVSGEPQTRFLICDLAGLCPF